MRVVRVRQTPSDPRHRRRRHLADDGGSRTSTVLRTAPSHAWIPSSGPRLAAKREGGAATAPGLRGRVPASPGGGARGPPARGGSTRLPPDVARPPPSGADARVRAGGARRSSPTLLPPSATAASASRWRARTARRTACTTGWRTLARDRRATGMGRAHRVSDSIARRYGPASTRSRNSTYFARGALRFAGGQRGGVQCR